MEQSSVPARRPEVRRPGRTMTPSRLDGTARRCDREEAGSFGIPLPDRPLAPALGLVGPLVEQGRERLDRPAGALAAASPSCPFDPASVAGLALQDALSSLVVLLSRASVLELHIARLRGTLRGRTPEERFRRFFAELSEPERRAAFLARYPLLAAQASRCMEGAVESSVEFLTRLCADWDAIVDTLSPGDPPGVLVGMHRAGDKHRNGRSVIVARFSRGLVLVYKPRSLAVDAHFQELLAWVGARGGARFRRLELIDRGTHGWMEHVSPAACGSRAEIGRFYRRQGAYLALLYALGGTDVHHENLVAAGEHPVLIDVEALFSSRVSSTVGASSGLEPVGTSVLATGLLPCEGDGQRADLSGLGATEGEPTPHLATSWDRPGTDEMKLVFTRASVPESGHRPRVGSVRVDPSEHVDGLLAGFEETYGLLLSERDALVAEGGPLARFEGDEVRTVLRPTQIYAALIEAGLHPDLLREHGARDRLLQGLDRALDRHPGLAPVVVAERADLEKGDVPILTTKPGSRALWTSDGRRLDAILETPGLELARRRLAGFDAADLSRQAWLIRASLAASAANRARRASMPPPEVQPQRGRTGRSGTTSDCLIARACGIGDRLEQLAWPTEAGINWIGLSTGPGGRWSPTPLGLSLYDGLSGVTLFLFHLGARTGQTRFTALAEAALGTLRDAIGHGPPSELGSGAFTGLGGVVYTLAHVGALTGREELLAEAVAVARLIAGLATHDVHLDVLSGSAGCILALLSLYRCISAAPVLDAAIRCGERLVDTATGARRGVGWPCAAGGGAALSGLSHGAAGIALALLELWSVTGRTSFRATALRGLEYERSLYCPDTRNWQDLRTPGPGERPARRFATAWCHGAPGVALARLAILPHVSGPEVRGEIKAALGTTLAGGFGRNHSLCHGDLGNIEPLLWASQTLGSDWKPAFERATRRTIGDIERRGWQCATPSGLESPGLMAGLAGIGYGLLRLAAPAEVPSVLVLAPPGPHAQASTP